MNREFDCTSEGFGRGPNPGGYPDTYLCEKGRNHKGDHAWRTEGDGPIITWPAADPLVKVVKQAMSKK